MDPIKVNQLEIENVKRIRAVKVQPTASGLTVLGGKNRQGKTSVLDAICWALGGDRYKPSEPTREGSVIPPNLKVIMNNGLVVERTGKNSTLKVTDPNGKKGGQQLLNEFVEQLALDLPRFMGASNKDKAATLLQIIGVGDQLAQLERQETEIYNRRHAIGQIKDQKEKFAKEQVFYPDAPRDPISASELIKQQQDILARNGENQRKRDNLRSIENQLSGVMANIEDLKKTLAEYQTREAALRVDLETARKSAADIQDESTAELEANIQNIEAINIKVRANLDKAEAEEDAKEYAAQYQTLTAELDVVRQKKIDLLNDARLPLPGLGVQDGELTYQGRKWDGMSGADQLIVATSIVRELNPKCGFVLMDKLEAMDLDTLAEFNAWLEQEGLQAIATRVSTGDECSIVIQDGYAVGAETPDMTAGPEIEAPAPAWKAGEF